MRRQNAVTLTPAEVTQLALAHIARIDPEFAKADRSKVEVELTEAGGLRVDWQTDIDETDAQAAEQLLMEEISQRDRNMATYTIDDPADNPAGEKEGVSTIERAVQATVPAG